REAALFPPPDAARREHTRDHRGRGEYHPAAVWRNRRHYRHPWHHARRQVAGTTTLCTEGYFTTLGIRLRAGRFFSETEVDGARKVAVVNQFLVTKFLANQNPIGRQVRLNVLQTAPGDPVRDALFEIVGVVNDSHNQGIDQPPQPEVFVPQTVTGAFERLILVRTAGDPLAMVNTV